MKKYIYITILSLSVISFTSCNDWLTEPSPGVTKLEDFFTTAPTAIQAVNAAYTPLMWELNNTYYQEWFIGDIVSDDALKGGQNISDMANVFDLENFKTNTNNSLLLEFYRAQYQGVGRANLVIQEVPKMKIDTVMTTKLKDRLVGEAKFLRAMYYFRLVRIFAGVPKIDFVIEGNKQWIQPRATADEIYAFIIDDLLDAEKKLWKKSEYDTKDLGRATKGAAQAMLLKTYLYTHNYAEAEKWGKTLKTQAEDGEYSLIPDYQDNFTLIGENGRESIFEIQYMEEANSDFGEGNGFSRGTFNVILTRSRSSQLGSGWGFNKPTQDLYNEYEANDPRRDATIINPSNSQIENPAEEIYLGNRYVSRKYAMMKDGGGSIFPLSHVSRGPINTKVIRYADVLLMYAEACCENNHLTEAKEALEQVRNRARNGNNSILPAFPNYNGYTDTQADLRKAIRHERRVELAMEGHRWFDICRWGIAKKTMDAYKANETEEVRSKMAEFIEGKHELFPIPAEEVNLGKLTQNPLW